MAIRKIPVQSQSPLNTSFEKLVHSTLQKWHVPGVAIGVVDGEHTWTEGYGISSFPSSPVTPSTLFYAGSTTKAFTAAIIATLVADNDKYPHIQWTTPVSHLIRDDFVLADEYVTQHITLEDILSHRTGLPRHDQAYGNNNMSRDIAVREIVRSLRHLPLTAEPRTRFQYSNLMFVVASHVIQSVTGQWLGDLLKSQIWDPLGMEATFFSLEDAQKADEELARGYEYPYSDDGDDTDDDKGGEKVFKEVEWMPLNEISGAGSVITNVLDYAKWARSLMNKSAPLSPEVHKAIWEPRTLLPTDAEGPFTGPVAYALGWTTGVYQGYKFYEHTGGMNAFGAELILFPELKYAVTILGNTAVTSNFAAKKLAFELIDEKIGVPAGKRFAWDAYNTRMINGIKSKAQNAVTTFYPSLPSPRLPTTLPLSAYAGTYTHPGYQSLRITINPSTSSPQGSGPGSETLHADRSFTTWSEPHLNFQHVSGDYFIIHAEHHSDLGAFVPNVYPAEFVLGSDGSPKKVGIGYEEEMGKDGRIWFERV